VFYLNPAESHGAGSQSFGSKCIDRLGDSRADPSTRGDS